MKKTQTGNSGPKSIIKKTYLIFFCSLAALCLLAGKTENRAYGFVEGAGEMENRAYGYADGAEATENRAYGYRSRAESADSFKTLYERVDDLAELPYFELDGEGRLALAQPDLAPFVDAHTHLALSYLRSETVDLMAEHPETEFYLPMSSPLDLDIYVNKNFEFSSLWRMKLDLSFMSFISAGMRRTHTVPNIIKDMDRLGIAISLLLPIDAPVLSKNAETYLEIAETTSRLVSLGSVHPFAPGLVKKLERQRSRGALGVKMHPMAQIIPPEHPKSLKLYRECAELGLPVLWHCGPVGIETKGGRKRCQLRRYVEAVSKCPRTCFILGHAGALQLDEALEIARGNPNIYMELASQSLPGIRRILDEIDPSRILFGSDWPFYSQAISLAKVLIATEGRPHTRRLVLRENAERLFGLDAEAAWASRELPRP